MAHLRKEVMSALLFYVNSPCRPCALANPQQGPLVSKTVHLHRTWGRRGVRGRGGRWETEWSAHNKEGHSLNWTCEASSAAHPHSTGSLLPWQETCWLHYYCCHVIQLQSQILFWWIQIFFFFPKSDLILQVNGPLSLQAKTTYTTLYLSSDHLLCVFWKANL